MTSTPLPVVPAATDADAVADAADLPAPSAPRPAGATRRRLKPGERREQILQTLAAMLEQPGAERITTAALAARLAVSEAALYRHFASKAQMFEGLIAFIEHDVFTLLNRIDADPAGEPQAKARQMLTALLEFGQANPGMTRVMVGDALVFENDRLLVRMNQFFERFESQLRQCLRGAADAAGSVTPTAEAAVRASVLTAFAIGRLQRYPRSGFKRHPTEHLEAALQLMAT